MLFAEGGGGVHVQIPPQMAASVAIQIFRISWRVIFACGVSEHICDCAGNPQRGIFRWGVFEIITGCNDFISSAQKMTMGHILCSKLMLICPMV